MFSSEDSSGRNASAVSGTTSIPTRFFWPYGGRSVFLTGSFTRWSEHVPMAPVEGCPTVFQAICSLAPGFHQYKFVVDGEWRHDEQQPFVLGNYGTVNTVLLTRDPDPIPALSNLDIPVNGASMDVDSETFQRVVTVSGGIPQIEYLKISDDDVTVSRHRISVLLSTHTAYDLLPDSGKVIALDVNLPVKQAFHILYEQGMPVAPLWDFSRRQFVGILSALDFILILRELGTHGSNLTEEELETHTISAWKVGKHLGRPIQRDLVHMGPYNTLAEIAVKILQNEVATVPVIHSSADGGSFPQLLHLASLSGILKCICRHFRHSPYSLPILQRPICSFPIGTWVPKIGEINVRTLAMLRSSASLSAALSLLVEARISSIPIVDENDSLVDVYSRSDITALAKDKVYAQVHLDKMNIHQALQLGQEANSPYGVFNGQRCHMCLRTDSLQKVMERLANPGVRRVIIVEAGSNRVEGIISLSDMFRFLLG